MPFLLVTGFPSCGKSTIVDRIVDHFKENGKDVVVVREDDYNLFNRGAYNDSTKEREFRSHLRSQIQKNLNKNTVVVCDGLNYIKGFRYELFLIGKLARTTYAVLQIDGTVESCKWLNTLKEEKSRYSNDKILDLIMRYEKPDARQRWDSPLYHVQIGRLEKNMEIDQNPDDMTIDLDRPAPRFVNLPLDEIYDWLMKGIALTENKSTATAPIAPINYLHELDRATQEVVQFIIASQRTALPGQEIIVPMAEDGKNKFRFTKIRSLPELSRLRRQYITFSKTHPIDEKETIVSLFIDYLNSNTA